MFRPPWRRAPRRVSVPRWAPVEETRRERFRAVIAERDQLRAKLMARDADAIDLMNIEYGCPDCGVHHACGEIVAERDRLRAVVDGYTDDLSHIAFAVADYRTGAVHHDNILGLVQSAVAERDRLRAVVGADDWAGVAMKIMLTIDGGRRTWADPIDEQLVAAIAELEAERDRLRAVVDAVLIWQRQMADLACAVDVPHVADLYRIVTAELDVSADMGDHAEETCVDSACPLHGGPEPLSLEDDSCLFCQPKTGVTFDPRDQHAACGLRSVVGGIGHLVDHTYWCVERGNPDASLTYRESALRVAEWVQAHGMEAASAVGDDA